MVNAEVASLPLDAEVARAKFAEAIAQYRAHEASYLAQGCWLLSAEFPKALFAFVHPQLRPHGVIFGAEFDFANYDLWPISVRFMEPFKRQPYTPKTVPTPLTRLTPGGPVPLIQAHSENDIPFLCLQGVREYHNHPAHTGDAWLLHRGKGEGTLTHLLSVLIEYGINAVRSYQFGLNITINGFQFEHRP